MNEWDPDKQAELDRDVDTASFQVASMIRSIRELAPDDYAALVAKNPHLDADLDEWVAAREASKRYLRETRRSS